MMNQHTEMMKQLQDRHTEMLNKVNLFTNCRIELHGYDMSRNPLTDPDAKEMLKEKNPTCSNEFFGTGRKLQEEAKIKVNTIENHNSERMMEELKDIEVNQGDISKVLHDVKSLEKTILGEVDEVEEYTRSIIDDVDTVEDTDLKIQSTLEIMLSTINAIHAKLNLEPFANKKNAKSKKSKKAGKDTLFHRNLLETSAADEQTDEEEESVEKKILFGKVQSIEGKVQSIEGKVQSIEGKVEKIEKSIEELKQLMVAGVAAGRI